MSLQPIFTKALFPRALFPPHSRCLPALGRAAHLVYTQIQKIQLQRFPGTAGTQQLLPRGRAQGTFTRSPNCPHSPSDAQSPQCTGAGTTPGCFPAPRPACLPTAAPPRCYLRHQGSAFGVKSGIWWLLQQPKFSSGLWGSPWNSQ